MTLSRQRKWQLKKKAEGLCQNCGKPAEKGIWCKACGRKKKEENRLKRGFKQWVSGGKGRPPIY